MPHIAVTEHRVDDRLDFVDPEIHADALVRAHPEGHPHIAVRFVFGTLVAESVGVELRRFGPVLRQQLVDPSAARTIVCW